MIIMNIDDLIELERAFLAKAESEANATNLMTNETTTIESCQLHNMLMLPFPRCISTRVCA